jgi:hypothetical protein
LSKSKAFFCILPPPLPPPPLPPPPPPPLLLRRLPSQAQRAALDRSFCPLLSFKNYIGLLYLHGSIG